jgi:ribosomal protein S12 methylthiotransferase
MALQRKISRRNLRRMVWKSLPVLVEGPSPETELLYQGRGERQAPGIDGCILINDFEGRAPLPGDFRWATITDAGDYDLVARLGPVYRGPDTSETLSPEPKYRPSPNTLCPSP